MLKPNKYLGGASDCVPAQLLPGTKNPNILVFSKINSLILWNPKTKSNLAILEEIDKVPIIITKVKLSRNLHSKEFLVTAGLSSGKILVWKLDLVKISIKFAWYTGHSLKITSIRISKNGTKVLSGCLSGDIILWNSQDNTGIFRNKLAHNGKIKGLNFCTPKNDKWYGIFSYGIDNLLKFWDMKTGICKKIIDMGTKCFQEFKFLKNKNLFFALARDGELTTFLFSEPFILKYYGNFQNQKTSHKPNLLFDFKESILILNDGSRSINVFLSRQSKINPKYHYKGENFICKKDSLYSNVMSYQFKNKTTGLTLWSTRNRGSWVILVHDFETHSLDFFKIFLEKKVKNKFELSLKRLFRRKLEFHSGEIRRTLWFLKDKFLITLCSSSNSVYIWNVTLEKCIKKFKTHSSCISMELFDSNSILTGSITGNIDLYEILSGKLIFSRPKAHEGPVWALDCAENSYYLATGSSDKVMKIWELELNRIIPVKKLRIKEQILNIKLILEKNLIILSGISSVIWAFSFQSLEYKFSLQGHSLPIISASLCDNKKLLLTGSADSSLRIWDLLGRNQKKILFPENTAVTSTTFQPCSINFLSASRGGNIRFWNGSNFTQLCQFIGYHQGPIWTLNFSENGNFLASGSADKNVIIWKIERPGLQILSFKKENNFISSINNLISDRKKIKRNKNIFSKFISIIKLLCQLRKKKVKKTTQIESYLKKLFFKIKRKHLFKLLKSIENFEFIIFLDILIIQGNNFNALNVLSNFPEILIFLSKLERFEKNSKKKKIFFKIKKKIGKILKKEQLQVKKTINRFKLIKKIN